VVAVSLVLLPLEIIGLGQIAKTCFYFYRTMENTADPILKLLHYFVSYIT